MSKPHRTVLVIPDSRQSGNDYEHQLLQEATFSYQVLVEPYSPQIATLSSSQQVDSILLELYSPYASSLQFLGHLTTQMGDHGPPIVVVDSGDVEVAVQALKQGAVDYLVKDRMTPEDLRLAVRSAIENAELRQALQRSQDRFQTSVENMLDCFGIFSAMRNQAGQIIDFRIDYLNAAACENNQLPKAMQIGRGLCELLPAHRTSGLFDAYCRLVETGEPLIKDSLIYDDTYGDDTYGDDTYGERRLVRAFDIRATRLNDGFVASWRDVTERKRLELELNQTATDLRQQQHRLQRLIDTAPIGIGIGSADGNVKVINDAMLQLHGYSRQEFEQQGMNWREFVPPEDAERTQQAMEQLRQQGFLPPEQKELLQRDGSRVPIWISAMRWLDGTDEHVAFAVDLTRQKQAEAALQANQQRYRDLAEAMPQMVWSADTTGAVNYWNHRWYEYTGLSEVESLGLAGVETVYPEERERTLAQWRRSIDSGESFEIEYRLRRWDGVYHWFICRAIPTKDAQNQITGWIGTITDINHIKHNETQVRNSEHELQAALQKLNFHVENSPLAVIEWDHNFRVSRWSKAAERIFGWRAEEVLGKHVDEFNLVFAADVDPVANAIEQLSTGEATQVVLQNRNCTKTGAVIHCEWYNSALLNETGELCSVLSLVLDITDRIQAQQELREGEARFRTLADNISQLAWMTDEQGWICWYNQRWFDYTGTTLAQVQGWGWQQVHHPDHIQRVVNKFRRCMATGETWEDTFPLRGQDGQYRWFLSRAIPVRDEQGNVLRWFGTNTDITELRQTERALQQATERLDLALRSAPLTLFNQDLDLRYTWVYNPTQDYTIQDVIGQRDQDLVSPKTAARLTQLKRQVLETGVGLREEVKVIKDGQTAYYDLTIDPIRDRQNAIIGITCAAVDISERARLEAEQRQAEAALRASEERYRTLFESMDEGFCVIEVLFDESNTPFDYRFLEVNPRFEQQTGLQSAQGKTARQLLPHLERHWFEIYGAVALTGEAIHFENGSEVMQRWFDVSAFRTGQPEDRKVAILFRDITERKLADQDRERLLAQEQAARAEAERANRIKDEFLAVLSHELRSPLNPILGWAKLLQTRPFDAAQTAEALAIIERNARLQTQLIDDLLDIAKILRGKLSLNVTAINLSTVIEAALETVTTAALAKAITLHPVLLSIGQVSGDAARLQQVVWNLLSNAVKFTPQGGRVEVKLEAFEGAAAAQASPAFLSGGGPYAQMTVTDTGKGISPDFLPHLFESFRQEDASTTRKYGGLGLGLAIVRQLVEAHGGTITADSPGEGMGATFTVRLPLLTRSQAEPWSPQTLVPLGSPSLTDALSLAGIRVLAVDDDPDARELLTVLLSRSGAEVQAVSSAAEVLTALESSQPDVLISDIAMPDIDGYTLIQQIRALPPPIGQIPAIALTAYAREDDYQRAIHSGFQRHITKPLDPEQLIQTVVALTRST